MWKKIMTINFLLLISIISISPFFISRNRGFPELWDAPIRILDPDWDKTWFLKGKGGRTYTGCLGVSNKIGSIIRTNSSEFFSEIYVNHVSNKYWNIVYLSLTDISPETTGKVLDLLRPPRGTNIEFIEAPAPRYKVEEWMQEFDGLWPLLWSSGVHLSSLSITPNGTILLGLEEVTQEQIKTLLLTIKGRVPPGILVVHEYGPVELSGDEEFVTLEGMLSQEDGPDHDWIKDPVGPKVLSLDVLDPENNLNYETYYLNSRHGDFYIFFPLSRRINDSVWAYRGPKPVKITGILSYHVGANEKVVDTLRIFQIEYSGLGQWFEGVLGTREIEVGSYQYHNRLYPGRKTTFLSLTLDPRTSGSRIEEVYLASHEGYVYDVPYCGTGQPIVNTHTGQSVSIRGLMTEVVDSKNQIIPVLMVFEVNPS